MVVDFLRLLAANLLSGTDGDRLRWKLTKNRDFTIRSFTISYMVLLLLFFLGKAFGRLRHPDVSLSLCGQQHGIGSSWELTCDSGVLTLSTGALCVIAVVRQWIICCYIVERLINCGALSLGFLGFLGFPHVKCQIFYLVGGIGWGSIPLTFGT